MKPRAFIGSSVEGIGVAYAVQQNLLHDAEVTVWDQGVFELSATTIESLTKALTTTDFGIFVFSPDDVVKLRDQSHPSVRDNVLFEFGLFIGSLGRERVFYLLPSGSDINIPSDLLGVTPAKYETTRSDGSMQAATGAACHQMRSQIKALGIREARNPRPSLPEDSTTPAPEKKFWIQDFFEGKYDSAKATLREELTKSAGDEAIALQAWVVYCDFKQNKNFGYEPFETFAKSHSNSARAQTTVALFLKWEHYLEQAINTLMNAKRNFPDEKSIDINLAECHTANEELTLAEATLQDADPAKHPTVAIAFAELLEKQDKKQEALTVLQGCFALNPRSESVQYKYARLAQDLEMNTVALYLLNDLVRENPKSSDYLGYLGNCCLSLRLYDRALYNYRRAETIIDPNSRSQWVTSNIGNLLTHKGLHAEACTYLERALSKEPASQYAHDRLASALKSKDESIKEYEAKCTEGSRAVKEAAKKLRSESKTVVAQE